jgi:acyl-CoA thioester hydrolase
MVNIYRLDARLDLSARLGDWLEVQTGMHQRSSHRIAFDQRIVNAATGRSEAEATVEVLFVDREGKLATVPAELCGVSTVAREPLVRTMHGPRPGSQEVAFRRRFRVYYEDTDAQAIAYHVTYVRFCERALLELLDEVFARTPTPLFRWLDSHTARVVGLNTRYMRSTKLGDTLEVRVYVRELSRETGLVTLDMQLGPPGDPSGAISAAARLDVRFADLAGDPAELPEALSALGEA